MIWQMWIGGFGLPRDNGTCILQHTTGRSAYDSEANEGREEGSSMYEDEANYIVQTLNKGFGFDIVNNRHMFYSEWGEAFTLRVTYGFFTLEMNSKGSDCNVRFNIQATGDLSPAKTINFTNRLNNVVAAVGGVEKQFTALAKFILTSEDPEKEVHTQLWGDDS